MTALSAHRRHVYTTLLRTAHYALGATTGQVAYLARLPARDVGESLDELEALGVAEYSHFDDAGVAYWQVSS